MSQVPVWREGLAWSVPSLEYQRILEALADQHRLHQGPLNCQELAVMFGLDAVPAKVEALRSSPVRCSLHLYRGACPLYGTTVP